MLSEGLSHSEASLVPKLERCFAAAQHDTPLLFVTDHPNLVSTYKEPLMKPTSRRPRLTYLALLFSTLVGLATIFTAAPMQAASAQSGQLTWRQTAGHTVEFAMKAVLWRSLFTPLPNVGDTLSNMGIVVMLGDGTAAAPALNVISVDAVNDIMVLESAFSHTYAGLGPYAVAAMACCRPNFPQHINNGTGHLRLETIVDLAATTASPVSSIAPIVDCPTDATCTFVVPASDPDGQELRFRFATDSEATVSAPFYQPGPSQALYAATIDATTGRYTWDTTGAILAPTGYNTLYSTQVIVENVVNGNVVTKTPVDFLIRLTDQAPPNHAPAFTSPTPTDGTVLDVTVGSLVAFDVAASDLDTGDTVSLRMLSKPASATFMTTAGNPATGTFTWTPTVAGTTLVSIIARDQHGLDTAARSVAIQVAPANQPPTANASADQILSEGATAVLDASGSADPEGEALAYSWALVARAGPAIGLSSVTAAQPTFATTDNGVYTFRVTVSDDTGGVSTDDVTIAVDNVAPTITGITANSALALVGKPADFTGAATDPSSADLAAGLAWQWVVNTDAPNTDDHTFSTRFPTCGSYSISATTMDKDGGISALFAFGAMNVYEAQFQQPLNEGMYNTVQKGRVVPVKIAIGCAGVPLAGLTPAIQLLSGDRSDASETGSDEIETTASSGADTTGVMRPVDDGYRYNLQVPSNATAGQLFTIRVRPFGDANPGASIYAVLQIRR
jgi:hypothetical protein